MDSKSDITTPENKQFVFSRYLPRTSQTTLYRIGDDGDHQAGWSIGTRFITKIVSGGDIVFDRATGLMWVRDFDDEDGANVGEPDIWEQIVDYANGLYFAGYADWRLPNVKELISIVDYSHQNPCWYDVFVSGPITDVWTSTSFSSNPSLAWFVNGYDGGVNMTIKLTQKRFIGVRGGRLNG